MDEQQFRKLIIQIRALARSQGETISKEQVHKKFLPLNVEEGQFLLIFKYLDEEKVTLYDTEEERASAMSASGDETVVTDYDEGSGSSYEVSVSDEDGDYLKIYIEELDSLDIPDKEERGRIIEEVLKDRDSAVQRLPNLYLKEVVDVARLYAGQGVAIEDLVGEGNIGVLSGVRMLDCCESVTEVDEFMMKMIMDSMESLIMDNFSLDEFDLKVVERVNELNDRSRELAEEMERLVTVDELVKELEQDEEYIRETIRLAGNAIPYIEGYKEIQKN